MVVFECDWEDVLPLESVVDLAVTLAAHGDDLVGVKDVDATDLCDS